VISCDSGMCHWTNETCVTYLLIINIFKDIFSPSTYFILNSYSSLRLKVRSEWYCFIFRWLRVQVCARRPEILAEVSAGFSNLKCWNSTKIVSSIFVQIHNLPAIRSCITYAVHKAVLKGINRERSYVNAMNAFQND
jgi:hypothetical protein